MTAAVLLVVTSLASAQVSPVDFDTEVVPILTKAGCNAASCHGSAAGRGGFRLSLFGGDAAADYHTIVHELESRRINHARPGDSLLIAKPTVQLEHGGDLLLDDDGPQVATLERWIAEGAARLQLRRLESLRVEPAEMVVAALPAELQLSVVAHFDDGTQRDVAAEAVYVPGDEAAVEVSPGGKLTVRRRGRHTVVVRYLSIVETAQVTAPLSDNPVDLSRSPRNNFIDQRVLQMLQTLRLRPSPQADDAVLLRRVRLDLTGRLPTVDEVLRYTADGDPEKFAKLVDHLLASEEFADYWTYRFAKLLRIRSQPKDTQGAQTFHRWLRDSIAGSAAYDEMVAAMLTAEGDTHQVGPANFYRVVGDARSQAEFTSEALMGVRLRCANCHNHPLDRWTQDDYHGLAAIFARIERGRHIRLAARGEVTHPRTGDAAVARIPGERFLDSGQDGRRALADWLTSRDNPYLAKATVNRLWKALMGRGLIEPTDDLRATNPATHPALLERLADDFVAHGYDLRHTLRRIATSAAYARSSAATDQNRSDDRFYSHALTKALEPEVLADAIYHVTGVADRYGRQPPGTRAVVLFDPKIESASLDILGRCSREESCETPGGVQGGLTTKLHLMNGPLLNRKIAAAEGTLRRQIDAQRTNAQIVEHFYLQALGRVPRDEEKTYWHEQLQSNGHQQRRQRLEDFAWSLLGCREFATNH